jgi:hypothetical protein
LEGPSDENEIGMACSTHGEKKNAHRTLVGNPEGKRPTGRPRPRLHDNIKMDLRALGWGCVGWIYLTQDRNKLEGSCEHGNEPLGSKKCWELVEQLHNWRVLKKGSAPWS